MLNQALCRSYGLCVGIDPDIFTIPPGAPVAAVIREVAGPDDLEDVQEAIRSCPTQAISLAEEG